ncbi:MAG: hypothetical protein AAF514_09475, partial [Verrucomicrobiota bacterium]
MKLHAPVLLAAAWLAAVSTASSEEDLAQWLSAIQAVSGEGHGNEKAAEAWKSLVQQGADQIPTILKAMDESNDLATNWFRGAVDAIADRTLKDEKDLPVDALGAYLLDVRHHPRARRLAFELIDRVDTETAQKLIPGMLNDPSVE